MANITEEYQQKHFRSMFSEVRKNKAMTSVIIFFFLLLISVLGVVFGIVLFDDPFVGLIISAFVGLIYSIIAYFSGKNMIMAMNGAKLAKREEYPYIHNKVEALCIPAGIPKPDIYIIKTDALNAFATGRDPEHSAIAFTTGIIKTLNREELEGVIAHEMSHIKNYDIKVMMTATVLVGIVTFLAQVFLRSMFFSSGRRDSNGKGNAIFLVIGIILAILAPIFALILQFAISRKREYLADTTAAVITRYPPGLASALEKIKSDPKPKFKSANTASSNLYINDPFKKSLLNLFSTHPPIDERIKRLSEM